MAALPTGSPDMWVQSDGTLGFSGGGAASDELPLASSGSLSIVASAIVYGSMSLASSGTLGLSAIASSGGELSLVSSGSLTFSGVASAGGSLSLASSESLSFGSSGIVYGSLALTSSGSLATTGSASSSSALALMSLGSLGMTASATATGLLSLASSGVFHEAATIYAYADLALSSGGTLSFLGSSSVGIGLASHGTISFGSGTASAPASSNRLTLGSSGRLSFGSSDIYHVYWNTGSGDAVNYGSIIATTNGLSYTLPELGLNSDNTFAVRAYDPITGLEDQNIDCRIRIVIDGSGNDITMTPVAPNLLGVVPFVGGTTRVDWLWLPASGGVATYFDVYLTAGSSISYSSPAVTVMAFGAGVAMATLTGLTDGTSYVVAVKARNALGSSPGSNVVPVTGSVTPPVNVDGLTGIAVL